MYLVCYNIPMNILVLSDTHGELGRALEMYERISTSICKIDRIIHCGDFIKDAQEIEAQTGIPVSCVPGNCDGCNKENFEIIDSPAGKIMITHGHMENVKFSLMNLKYLAMQHKCVAVCFGHTHVPVNEVSSGIRFINPGSLTNPRGGSKSSCALIISEEKKLAATIIEY